MDGLMLKIVEALLPVIATLATAVLVQWFRKLGLEVTVANETRLREITEAAILRAEEYAASQAKQGYLISSEDKKRQATRDVLEKLPKVSVESAHKSIDSTLPAMGLGASNPPTPSAALDVTRA